MADDLTHRLGVNKERFGKTQDLLQTAVLPDPDLLFDSAFKLVTNPDGSYPTKEQLEQAQIVLATALLSKSKKVEDTRLMTALPLLARLVANADPEKILGSKCIEERDKTIPNGWRYATDTWTRVRYGWREGLENILDVKPEHKALAEALDELTRLNPLEPDEMASPPPASSEGNPLALGLTLAGLTLSIYGIVKTAEQTRKIEEALKTLKRAKRKN